MKNKKKKILITGSSGFIGSCLKNFLKKKYKLYLIDKKKLKINEKNFFLLDLKNNKKVLKVMNIIKPDIIIHLAAQSNLEEIKKRSKYIQNNITATNNVLNAMKIYNINKIIFSSSANIYSNTKKKVTEKSNIFPKNIYSQTKLSCEKNIINKSKTFKLNYIIFRFFNVCSALKRPYCGSLHFPETSFIPIIVNKFLKNKTIKLYSKGIKDSPTRDYIHIFDLCNAISSFDLINFFDKKFANNRLKFKFTKTHKDEIKKSECSNIKIKRSLSWNPQKSKLKIIFKDELDWQKYCINKKIFRKFVY
jgi:UDP-glucose 4-epimerase